MSGSADPLPTLEGVSSFARRHAALALVLALVGATVGLLIATLKPDTYVSTTTVLLDVPAGAEAGGGEETLDTLARLAYSSAVVDAVSEAVGNNENTVIDRLGVGAVPLSRLLVIDFVADNPDLAQRGAAAAASATIDQREAVFGVSGSVVVEATLPASPVDENTEVYVVSGALLGMLLAVGLSLARESLRPPSRAPAGAPAQPSSDSTQREN